jgi:hypothetical protein
MVDENLIGSGYASQAAICGLNGEELATSYRFHLPKSEIQGIIAIFTDPKIARNGVQVNGVNYNVTRVDDSVIYGKNASDDGVFISKTITAFVVGIQKKDLDPKRSSFEVAKLADYLKDNEL